MAARFEIEIEIEIEIVAASQAQEREIEGTKIDAGDQNQKQKEKEKEKENGKENENGKEKDIERVASEQEIPYSIFTPTEKKIYTSRHRIFQHLAPAFRREYLSQSLSFPSVLEKMGKLLTPSSISPIISSLLSQYLFPESCRAVVGNEADAMRIGPAIVTKELSFPNPLKTLALLFEKETSLVLMSSGILFAGYYGLMAGLPSQLEEKYGYNALDVGLRFLASGIGGSWTIPSIDMRRKWYSMLRIRGRFAVYPLSLSRPRRWTARSALFGGV
ncbi:hypothetical protein K504DRAFT_500952 [Pleomassaria siparia CBS 279.74]|uniref:MFS general substrate transporter n=1 Tax=Pleomassaria siparia CBS 279.74 TaxID=1314801 RepID=A0A6G1KDQ3_9PLEO|nr:hypothetical protein K504DRAFT_500952 [Pleomassaria siparia CBS 279.74]